MIRFEWDEEKRLANLKRHRIDFKDVYRVLDFDRFLLEDDRYDYEERPRSQLDCFSVMLLPLPIRKPKK